jgi:TPR repeat protein
MKTRLIILTTLMAVAMTAVGQNRYIDNIKKAEAGDAEAQVKVGIAYGNGEGVAKNIHQAVYWYRKSAENGNRYGQYNLGYCYYQGLGVTKDDK